MQSGSDLFGIPRQQDPPRSEVWVTQFNTLGSTYTSVISFLNTQKVIGSDITYNKSTVFGDSFVINTPGVYAIMANEVLATNLVITLNSKTLAGSLPSVPEVIDVVNLPANGGNLCVPGINLGPRDIIRLQAASLSGANSNQMFRITRVA